MPRLLIAVVAAVLAVTLLAGAMPGGVHGQTALPDGSGKPYGIEIDRDDTR